MGGDGLRMNRGNSLTGCPGNPMTMSEIKTTYNFGQRSGMIILLLKQVGAFSNGLINNNDQNGVINVHDILYILDNWGGCP